MPRRLKSNHLTWWLLVTLVFVVGVVLYGALTPSPPSAFDRPEARTNPPRGLFDLASFVLSARATARRFIRPAVCGINTGWGFVTQTARPACGSRFSARSPRSFSMPAVRCFISSIPTASLLAEASASRVFAEGAVRADGQIDELLDRAIVLARVAPSIKGVGDPISGNGEDHPALDFLAAAVNSGPSIYSAYFGLEDGSFLETIATQGDADIVKALTAPAGTMRVVRTVVPGNGQDKTQIWTYFDANGGVLARKTDNDPTFDPRQTDWYRRAKSESGTALTEPYKFSSIAALGLSVVRNLAGQSGRLRDRRHLERNSANS